MGSFFCNHSGNTIPAEAASKTVFKKKLTNIETVVNWQGDGSPAELSDLKFVCVKVGSKKVPVLIIKNPKATLYGQYNIYQYVNGKAKFLGSMDNVDCIYQNSGVIVTINKGGVGMNSFTDTTYYQVESKSKLGKEVAYSRTWKASDPYLKNEYRLGNKNTTAAMFNQWKENATSGKKIKILGKQFKKNTSANRKKYLK